MQILNLTKIGFLSIFSVMVAHQISAQTTVTFQPDGAQGKDTYITQQSIPPFGGDPTMKTGTDGYLMRSLIEFDLTSIPPSSIVTSAYLSFYGANGHVYSPYPNQCKIEVINQAWSEFGVDWMNQPSTTGGPIMSLPTSSSPTQNYVNLASWNLTNAVQNMVSTPSANHGFMIKSNNESLFKQYKLMQLATSDHPLPKMRPKLVVTYEEPSPVDVCDSIVLGLKGKESVISSINPNTNYGSHPDFLAMSWTFGGIHGDVHTLIEYDMSYIPTNAIVNSAELVLKGQVSVGNGSHYGPNYAWLEKVGSAWDEDIVTWTTAPSLTGWQIGTPIITGTQNHSFDITAMMQDMITNPSQNNGMMLKMQTPQHYRRQVYATGDHPNALLHPLLKICFTIPPSPPQFKSANDVELTEGILSLMPNPTTDYVNVNGVTLNNEVETYVNIYTADGKQVVNNQVLNQSATIELSNFDNGLYIIQLNNDGNVYTDKVFKQ